MIHIQSINLGQVQPLTDYHGISFISAVAKRPTNNEILLTKTGIEGDSVADTHHHGGAERALHLFSFEHYEFFNQQAETILPIPAFGENITLRGLTEKETRVGDILQIGTAQIQISQPTQRCRTMGRAIHQKKLLKWIHMHYMTGVYARVLKEGRFSVRSKVRILQKGPSALNVHYLNQQFFNANNLQLEADRIEPFEELSELWKHSLNKRL